MGQTRIVENSENSNNIKMEIIGRARIFRKKAVSEDAFFKAEHFMLTFTQ